MLALNTECAASGEFNTTSHSYRERKQLFSYLMKASKQVLHDKNGTPCHERDLNSQL
jgi:hypothetical protein